VLNVYRRHQPPCRFMSRPYRNCNCPISVHDEWVSKNPARSVKAPKVTDKPFGNRWHLWLFDDAYLSSGLPIANQIRCGRP
jgi:hypothetical protein